MQKMIQSQKNRLTLTGRIKQVIEFFICSQRQMAQELNLDTSAFNRYIRDENEKMLWPLLPDILHMYPRLSRQWLYFGEGPMNIGMGVPLDREVPLQEIAKAVEHMALESGGTNATLLRYVAGLPLGEANSEDLKVLKSENATLKDEVLALQKRVIALMDEKSNNKTKR